MQVEHLYNAQGQQVIRRLTQAEDEIDVVPDLAGNRIAEYDYDSVAGTSTRLSPHIGGRGHT